MHSKLIWSVNTTDMDHQSFWHNMLHLTYESFVQYGSSNFDDYQFANHEILYLPSLLYTFLYNQNVM